MANIAIALLRSDVTQVNDRGIIGIIERAQLTSFGYLQCDYIPSETVVVSLIAETSLHHV